MLIARGHTHVGEADLRWAVVFAPKVWCVSVRRHGLVLDTRFVPAAAETRRATVCLYLVQDGFFAIHGEGGERFEAPAAFVVSDAQLDGARGERPFTSTSAGEPFSVIELHFDASDVTVPALGPTRLTLDSDTWRAAKAIAELPDDDAAFQQRVSKLLEHVASSGLIFPRAAAHLLDEPPKTFALLWRALRPMIERFYLTPTLQEVGDAAGVSLRQVDRYVQEFVTSFSIVGEGWRHATRHMRLKLAVLLLSADGASVADIARAVGYQSSDAMARAFRDADMPPPTVVQQQVRALAP